VYEECFYIQREECRPKISNKNLLKYTYKPKREKRGNLENYASREIQGDSKS